MKLSGIIEDIEFSEGRSRKEMGAGVEHKVYPSTTDPNVVYKLGSKRSIDSWVEEFKKDPSIFPKVYKRGSTKIKLKTEIPFYQLPGAGVKTMPAGSVVPVDYVEMERLDTNKVEKDWINLDKALAEIMEIDEYGFMDFLILHMTNSAKARANGHDYTSTIDKIDTQVKQYYPALYPVLLKYITLSDKIKAVTKSVPDLHRYNFGYDKKGNLKCLDF